MASKEILPLKAWQKSAKRRRKGLIVLITLPTLFAAYTTYIFLPPSMHGALSAAITILFALLFAWISIGFWSSLSGAFLLSRRVDEYAATKDIPAGFDVPNDCKTAILFPIYNENPRSVAAGIRTVWQSLVELGKSDHFDIFIISDSTKPDAWVQEEEVWRELCDSEDAYSKIYYRRRKKNMKRKSGNVADFCRRWGKDYKYMIVFDADSLMTAETLCRMVQVMEHKQNVGILQTPPKAIKSRSLIARAQQFANHLYGPIFAAGLQYWQLGDAQYWGHNAIIRIDPFIKHCQLPILPGRKPLGGEILSHDFVEAALMRKAGFSVWLAYDLDGSYEQNPPSLIDELVRDRRWCQGNLQHSKLVFGGGFFPTHRALFINGIMSYVSALLWLLFLLCSSAMAIVTLFGNPDYFLETSDRPVWPIYDNYWALSLFSTTLILLFLPKIIAVIIVIYKRRSAEFGGKMAMF